MKLTTVRCNECGASLETSEAARYLTCSHCGCQLSIQRTSSSIFTEKLDAIAAQTGAMAENLDYIRIQNEIAQLDREWAMERERYLIKGKDGHLHEPGGCSMIASGMIVVMGLVWAVAAEATASTSGGIAIFGVIIMLIGIASLVTTGGRAGKLKTGRAAYVSQRRQLQAKLAQLR